MQTDLDQKDAAVPLLTEKSANIAGVSWQKLSLVAAGNRMESQLLFDHEVHGVARTYFSLVSATYF